MRPLKYPGAALLCEDYPAEFQEMEESDEDLDDTAPTAADLGDFLRRNYTTKADTKAVLLPPAPLSSTFISRSSLVTHSVSRFMRSSAEYGIAWTQ